jgi:hypothetical protein
MWTINFFYLHYTVIAINQPGGFLLLLALKGVRMLKKVFFLCFLVVFVCHGIILAQTPTPSAPARTAAPYPFYFSFASDDHHDGPTFESPYYYVIVCDDVNVDLMLDRNADYTGGTVVFDSILNATLFTNYGTYDYCTLYNGYYLHTWLVRGEIHFALNDPPDNPLILTIEFDEAVLTSYSPDTDRTGETMTLEISESVDADISFTAGEELEDINIWDIDFDISEDFAFTMTNVRIDNDEDERPRIVGNGYFLDNWKAEGSFSASANTYTYPTPTSIP